MSKSSNVVIVLVALAIAVFLGFEVMSVAMNADSQRSLQEFEGWCESQDGTLINVNSLVHGGLHCELPNGDLVHMNEVENLTEVPH